MVKLLFIRWTNETRGEARRHNHLAGSKSITGETMKLSRRYLPTTRRAGRKCRPFRVQGAPRERQSLQTIVIVSKRILHTHESVTAIAISGSKKNRSRVLRIPSVLPVRYCSRWNLQEINFVSFSKIRDTDNEKKQNAPTLHLHLYILQMIILR